MRERNEEPEKRSKEEAQRREGRGTKEKRPKKKGRRSQWTKPRVR